MARAEDAPAAARERWLCRLGACVVAAGLLVVVLTLLLGHDSLSANQLWLPVALASLAAVASAVTVRVRVRALLISAPWTDTAVLVALVVSQAGWVPASIALGVMAGRLITNEWPGWAAYHAAQQALAAAAGLSLALALGIHGPYEALSHIWQLALVAGVVVAAGTAIDVPVAALSTAIPWRRVLLRDWDVRLAALVGKFLVAVLALAIVGLDSGLLLAIPPVVLCLHLIYTSRLRTRTEREAWQRLAATTDEMNDTDLDRVLAAAVTNAAALFDAEEVEIFLRTGPAGPTLVRGGHAGVTWSGDPGIAPGRRHDTEAVTARLVDPEGGIDVGELRLHFPGPVRLSDRERITLRAFVTSLYTAARNAAAFAEIERMATRNAYMAAHDPLTGLSNRQRLREQGVAALARDAPSVTALLVFDLNRFKDVNETLGHLAGDRLVVEVARRLSRVATTQELVARLGGDEFGILLSTGGGTAPADSVEVRIRQLLATLDAAIDLGSTRVRVEASAGVAIVDDTLPAGHHECMDELLRRADLAMYQAKRGGQRIAWYNPDRDTADLSLLILGGDVPRAIAEGEFTVDFQPILDLATGVMVGAEALPRWRHPDRGDLDPRRFLASVERSGQLPAFASAVLDQALTTAAEWHQLGIPASVSVNTSPRSLADPEYPVMVRDLLDAHGISAKDLVIELTEALASSPLEEVAGVLRSLRGSGVQLALDDFGTGYSSLTIIATVPVHELKIDRSFVAVIDSSPEAAAVVRSTVDLGRRLRLRVVAEGVDQADQRQALALMGCPAGQGLALAGPMPPDVLLERLRTGVDGVPGRLIEPL